MLLIVWWSGLVFALKKVVILKGTQRIACFRANSQDCCILAVTPEFGQAQVPELDERDADQRLDEKYFPVESHTAQEVLVRNGALKGTVSKISATIQCQDIREGELPEHSSLRHLNVPVSLNCRGYRQVQFSTDTLKYPLTINDHTVWQTQRARCVENRDTERAQLYKERTSEYNYNYHQITRAPGTMTPEEKAKRAAQSRESMKRYRAKKKAARLAAEASRKKWKAAQSDSDEIDISEEEEQEWESEEKDEADADAGIEEEELNIEEEEEDIAESSNAALLRRGGTMCGDMSQLTMVTLQPIDPDVMMAANILASITAPETPARRWFVDHGLEYRPPSSGGKPPK